MINNKVTYLYLKEDNFDKKLDQFLRSRNISDDNIEKIVFDIKVHLQQNQHFVDKENFHSNLPQFLMLVQLLKTFQFHR